MESLSVSNNTLLYTKKKFTKKLLLHINDLNNIENILKEDEGFFLENGYIKPNSTKYLTRSIGFLDVELLNANMYFNIIYEALVNDIKNNDIYIGQIQKIRYNIGLLCNIENIINVIVPYYDINDDDDFTEDMFIYLRINKFLYEFKSDFAYI